MGHCLDCFEPPKHCIGKGHDLVTFACQCPPPGGKRKKTHGCGIGCGACGIESGFNFNSLGDSEHGERWARPNIDWGVVHRQANGSIHALKSRTENSFLAPLSWQGELGKCFEQSRKLECFGSRLHICRCQYAPPRTFPRFGEKPIVGTIPDCRHTTGIGYPDTVGNSSFCRLCFDNRDALLQPTVGTSFGHSMYQYAQASVMCISNAAVFCWGFAVCAPGWPCWCPSPNEKGDRFYWVQIVGPDGDSKSHALWTDWNVDYGTVKILKHGKVRYQPWELANIDAKNNALDLLKDGKFTGMGRIFHRFRNGPNALIDYWEQFWTSEQHPPKTIYKYPKSYLRNSGESRPNTKLQVNFVHVRASIVMHLVRQGKLKEDRFETGSFIRPAIVFIITIRTELNEEVPPDDKLILVNKDGIHIPVPPWDFDWKGIRNEFSNPKWENVAREFLPRICRESRGGYHRCVALTGFINTFERGGYQVGAQPSHYIGGKISEGGRPTSSEPRIYGGKIGLRVTKGKETFRRLFKRHCFRQFGGNWDNKIKR